MESCCFRSGVKASAVTPQTKVEPGFIFHQFYRVLAGSCVCIQSMTCLRKAAKGKEFWMFATLFIKTKQTQCQWPALLVWPPQSVRIVSLIFRRKFPRLKLVFLSMEQVFLKPCSEMTIISHLSAKSIADHYFKCTQTSWAVCTRPPGVQLWVRINSDYRWTTDLTLINLPPDFHLKKRCRWRSDQWTKTNCSISCWEVIPSSVC